MKIAIAIILFVAIFATLEFITERINSIVRHHVGKSIVRYESNYDEIVKIIACACWVAVYLLQTWI